MDPVPEIFESLQMTSLHNLSFSLLCLIVKFNQEGIGERWKAIQRRKFCGTHKNAAATPSAAGRAVSRG